FLTSSPFALEAWTRHGLGLANYALGRHDDAVAAWTALVSRGVPAALTRDVSFWLGEALGRVGQHERAIKEINQVGQGGPHPLLEAGWARLGWWSLAAERNPESGTAVRACPASPTSAAPGRRAGAAARP